MTLKERGNGDELATSLRILIKVATNDLRMGGIRTNSRIWNESKLLQ